MSENQRTLENLLVDEQQMNKEILHDLLENYIRIGKQSGDLIPQEEFRGLTAKKQTLIVLLSQKARFELDMVESEWMSPGEISSQSGINKNTVYPTVRELANDGLLDSEDGSYRVQSHGIDRVRDFIEDGETNE